MLESITSKNISIVKENEKLARGLPRRGNQYPASLRHKQTNRMAAKEPDHSHVVARVQAVCICTLLVSARHLVKRN